MLIGDQETCVDQGYRNRTPSVPGAKSRGNVFHSNPTSQPPKSQQRPKTPGHAQGNAISRPSDCRLTRDQFSRFIIKSSLVRRRTVIPPPCNAKRCHPFRDMYPAMLDKPCILSDLSPLVSHAPEVDWYGIGLSRPIMRDMDGKKLS